MSVNTFLSPMHWDSAGTSNYIRIELYSMNWALLNVDLSVLSGVGASFSGPVAVVLNTNKMVNSTFASKWKDVAIFSSSGNLMSKIPKPSRFLAMGWTLDESLVCICDDGQISIFDIEGKPKLKGNKALSFGSDVRDISILETRIYIEPTKIHTGVAIVTKQYSFYVMPSIEQEKYIKYPDVPGLNMPPSSWCVYFPDRVMACILVAKDKQLFTLAPDGTIAENFVQTRNPVDSYIACAVSLNGKNLALMGDTGVIWLGSADMRIKYSEFDTQCKKYSPKDFVWCGQSAVVIYIKEIKTLFLVDISGNWIRYDITSDVILTSEMDGLRIFSEDTHEMIQRVPECVESIASIASQSAGANLYIASKEFENRSAKSYEYLEEYKSDLELAVEQCIQAAKECYFAKDQEVLLRAASFGKSFVNDFSGCEDFTGACRTLRVLNSIRDPSVGVPVTHQQYRSLTINVVIDRLISRNLWPLAILMCQHLQIAESSGASRVKKFWACWKISQDSMSSRKLSDEELAKVIRNKLENSSSISYAEIARRAIDFGRNELAIQLLNYETKSSQQIHLLIKLDRQNVALEKAIQSGDPFAIYEVILKLQHEMSSLEFQNLITSNKSAQSYYMKYLKHWNRDQLFRMYGLNEDSLNQGLCRVEESYNELNNDNKVSVLQQAKLDFNKAKAETIHQMTADQIKLYKCQQALEDEHRSPRAYFGLSVHQTISKLIVNGRCKSADNLRKEFKVAEKKFWWIKIQALAEREDWTELDKFSKSKKSPIGYVPFVEVCMNGEMKSEADKYVQRVPTEERVIPYILVGELSQAAEQAFVNKNVEQLFQVLDACSLSPNANTASMKALSTRIQTLIEKLQT